MTERRPVDTEAFAEADSFERVEGRLDGGLLVLVDHASNRIPPEYADLGLGRADLSRHIAYDVGAGPLGRAIAERLDAPAVLTRFSRLLIDPNRGEDDPTLIMRLSDGAVVPGNAGVDAGERERRLARFHRPYHTAVEALIDEMLATGVAPAIFSVHSYTPIWKGARRPWHAGVLWDRDDRFPVPLFEALSAEHGLRVGDNEPYAGSLMHDTMHRHGTRRGLAHALLEVRNDLIESPAGVLEWADRLEPILGHILADPRLHEIRHYGSQSEPDDAMEENSDAAIGRRHAHRARGGGV